MRRTPDSRASAILGAAGALCLASGAVPAARAAGGPGVVVLDAGSPWRCHLTWAPEVIRTAAGDLRQGEAAPRTPPPPADWRGPDFDDSTWAPFRGPIPQGSRLLALMCLRGRFSVDDPAAVGALTLSLGYRGGAVVYLNGQEVARTSMPQGAVGPDTPAEGYPGEAYVDPEGFLLRQGFGDPQKYADRFALRDRRLAGVTVQSRLLRKGVNVLAVELHRAPTSEVLLAGRARGGMEVHYCPWSMLLFRELTLTAPAGAALTPNTDRPAALQVFSHSIVTKTTPQDFGDPAEPPRSVRIVGCRSGAFAGQVVVTSTRPLQGLAVKVAPLAGPGGASIPAQAVQVRYGVQEGGLFDALEDEPPAVPVERSGAAVQPIWLTVRVPPEVAPGDYVGRVTVTADGAGPVEVPINLRVMGWTLPDSKTFRSHVGLAQSPDSVALKYNVPLWSEEHWRLLERTFALLGEVGADDVYIPLICGTYFGNEETMVRWTPGEGGGYTHDFSVAERYLDLAAKYLGRPAAVCLYLWDRQGGMWGPTSKDLGEQKKPAQVTRFDPATGQRQRMDAPLWGAPESVPFWKPVIEGLRERLRARGLEASMMVGVALDHRPPKVTVNDLQALAPGTTWVVHSHMGPGGAITLPIMGYGAHVWNSYRLEDPARRPARDWRKNPYIFTGFPRSGVGGAAGLKYSCPQDPGPAYRVLVEGLMACGHNGFGRVGVDFWPCHKDARGRLSPIYGGDAGDTSVTLSDSHPAVLAPGIHGPISTVRFEMLREGAQEAETRAFIETALTDPAARAKIGDDLADRARQVLDGRVRTMLRAMGAYSARNPSDWLLFRAYPWQDDSEALYRTAGEVATALAAR